MMHARSDYQRIQDPEEKIAADEPVFLLRGSDVSAPVAVRAWADAHEAAGGDPVIANAARAQALAMEAWPNRKVADVPAGTRILTSVVLSDQSVPEGVRVAPAETEDAGGDHGPR